MSTVRDKVALKMALDNPMFQEAIKQIRRDIADEILETKDSVQRDSLYYEAMALNKLTGRLSASVSKMAMGEENG